MKKYDKNTNMPLKYKNKENKENEENEENEYYKDYKYYRDYLENEIYDNNIIIHTYHSFVYNVIFKG
jgi:hypothetical protein